MQSKLLINPSRHSLKFITLCLFVLLITYFTYAAAPEVREDEQRDFPSLHITSYLHPFTQEREYWHNGTLTLSSDNPEWNFADVDVRLRGRGNSTWNDAPDKRPLRIRFETPQGLFGSEAHRDWILLANAFDGSLLRTHFTFYFARLLGDTTTYVPSSQFVHLYINGQYVGIYQVTDERNNGPGRGNVRVHSDPAISEYWIEMDMRTLDFFSINGHYYDLRMPSGDALTQAHIDYAFGYLSAVSEAIRERDWERITTLIDVQSFVDFYIVQEWSKELDVFISSLFMQILGQGEDRRLVMGPFWDFDNSFGNFNVALWGAENGPAGELWAQQHYWFRNLMRVPQFRDAVALRWVETTDAREATFKNLEYMARAYGHAFERNFQVQPMFAPPWEQYRSPYKLAAGAIWRSQYEYLTEFARARASWLNEHFDNILRGIHYIPILPTGSTLYVNGENITLRAYNIGGYNHFKLRDLAVVLSGTSGRFDVSWDVSTGFVHIFTGIPYQPIGGEMGLSDRAARMARVNYDLQILKDGTSIELTAYLIDGSNFVRLRDVMRLINVSVTWDESNNAILIDTSLPYGS